jgi:hypothetical protein
MAQNHPGKRAPPLVELIALLGGTDEVAAYDMPMFARRAGELITQAAPGLEHDKARRFKRHAPGPDRDGA